MTNISSPPPPKPGTQVWRMPEATSVLEAIRRGITLFVFQDFYGFGFMRVLGNEVLAAVTGQVTETTYVFRKFPLSLVCAYLEASGINSAVAKMRLLIFRRSRNYDRFTLFQVEKLLGWNGEDVREDQQPDLTTE